MNIIHEQSVWFRLLPSEVDKLGDRSLGEVMPEYGNFCIVYQSKLSDGGMLIFLTAGVSETVVDERL